LGNKIVRDKEGKAFSTHGNMWYPHSSTNAQGKVRSIHETAHSTCGQKKLVQSFGQTAEKRPLGKYAWSWVDIAKWMLQKTVGELVMD
jgi:hypothetical protein